MLFDDRLSTVLRQPATSEAIARIHYRQLIDLLGTSPNDAQEPRIDAAYLRLAELSKQIPAEDRAAVLREPSQRLRSPRLVAQLVEGEPPVAEAALGAASLSEEEWLDLIPALPIRARGAVRRRPGLGPRVETLLRRLGIFERGLPPARDPVPDTIEQVVPPSKPVELHPVEVRAEEPIEGIGAIVRRIEEFRKTRDAATNDAPRLPLDDLDDVRSSLVETFDFATDAEGRIVWSDPPAAPMSVGLKLTASDPESPVAASAGLLAAFRQRQPVRAATLAISGAPAIAGDWQADAAPRFERPGGRFIGYCGRMRRPAPETALMPTATVEQSAADRMRQVLHELRTPVNAIQGFAEIIQQQLFGPTPHEYRALAATIASDGARMLAGFEELDRLVRLDAGALELVPGECDIAAVLAATVAQLEPYCTRRGSGFALEAPGGVVPVSISQEEAERLVWRLLATLAGVAAPGEVLKLRLREPRGGMVRIIARLPDSLARRDDAGLFHATIPAQQQALSAGMFGTGFALRLAAAEAQAAGGLLERRDGKLRITLPCPAAAAAALPAPDESANP